MNIGGVLLTLAVALIALIPSFLSARSSAKVRTELRSRREGEQAKNVLEQVYGQAYDRAQRINQEIVDGLREEIVRLKAELADLRTQMTRSESRNTELEHSVSTLERSVDRMSRLLEQHGIELPERGPRR